MLAVTGLLVGALFLHFMTYVLTARPAAANQSVLAGYSDLWRSYLGATPAASSPQPAAPTVTPPATAPLATSPPNPGETLAIAPDADAQAQLLSYFPLGAGNQWQYATHRESLSAPDSTPSQTLFKVTKVEDLRDGGHRYHAMLESVDVDYYMAGVDLLVARAGESDGVIMLRYPLEVGTTWESPKGVTAYSVAGDDAIDTAFGRLHCLRVDRKPLRGEGALTALYYSEGIGLVRQEIEKGLGEKVIWDLVGYQVNGRTAGTLVPK